MSNKVGSSLRIVLVLSIIVFLFGIPGIILAHSCSDDETPKIGMANPAAVYCEELGYEYRIIQTDKGERGRCIFSENATDNTSIKCDAWEFLEGKCGKEYSYCEKHGYEIEIVSDGKNPFSSEYAICVPKETPSEYSITSLNEKKAVTDLMNLTEKASVTVNLPTELERKSNQNIKTIVEERKYLSTSVELTPSTFDWRNKNGENWMTSVKNQGSCGSCWAFAAVGGVEAKINIAENDSDFDTNLAEQYLVSDCCDAGDCGGGSTSSALGFIQNSGISDEPCFPYTASDCSCSGRCSAWNKRLWEIDDYGYVPKDQENIKNYLIEKGPLVVSMDWGAGYYDNGIRRCSGSSSSWHAVAIVGYNDSGDYWLIKNSWGASWGDNGYGKVGFGECGIEDYARYIDLSKDTSIEELKVNDIEIYTGSKSGTLSDTYYKDGNYIRLAEDCSGISCEGLDARINFVMSSLLNTNSIDLIAYHRAYDEPGFNLSYWNQNNAEWSNLGKVPNPNWYLMKYKICNSKSECSKYLSSGNLSVKYYHPPCSLCDTDCVDIDWLYVEAIQENKTYCSASTNDASDEWITKVILNDGTKTSENSTYSDFSDTVFTTLNVGNIYTLYVEGHTTATYTEFVKAWIDFNNDKNFSEDEEIDLGNAIFNGSHTFSKTFTVPNNANISETRMRVYLKWGGAPSPCESANYGEVEDYKITIINDTTPPSVWISNYGVGYIQAGSPAVITAHVYDICGVSSVYAEIESPDENVLETIQLYDDGLHNDSFANDGIFGNSWVTDIDEKDYHIDFTATDINENTETYNNTDKFTTIPFLPTTQIILIDNSMYTSYINYYEDALNSNGYIYNLWDFDLRGGINTSILNSFELCIWSSPSFKVPSENQQSTLREFLDNKGNLFISGQDIGYYIGNTDFYKNYLHANYTQDDTNLYILNGVSGDSITDGITIGISEGDGANNQWWPSEINPITPAESIFFYDNSTEETESIGELSKLPESLEKYSNKTEEYSTAGISSSGTGALKVDTNTYKLVYFAFGFEAINSSENRENVIKRVIEWFDIDLTPPYVNYCYPSNDSYKNNPSQLIRASIKDNQSEIDNLSLIMNVEGINYTILDSALNWDGYYLVYNSSSNFTNNQIINVTVYARDEAKNAMLPYNWHFIIDTEKPKISLSFKDNKIIKSRPIEVKINISDNQKLNGVYLNIIDRNISQYLLINMNIINETPSYNLEKTWDIHGFKLSNGSLVSKDLTTVFETSLQDDAYLVAGYFNNSEAYAYFNKTNLKLVNITSMHSSTSFNITYGEDTFTSIILIGTNFSNITETNGSSLILTENFKLVKVPINDAHTFTFETMTYDKANNMNFTSINVTVDITPPTINILNPANGTVLATSSTWFNLTTNENSTCMFSLCISEEFESGGGGTCTEYENMTIINGNVYSQLITNLNDTKNNETYSKWYSLYANCSDNVKNSNKTNVILYIAAPPTILNAVITPSIVKLNSTVILTATITDNNAVNYAYMTGYNSSWNQTYQPQNLSHAGDNWFLTFNIGDVPEGIYYFNLTAVDNSGNNITVWADNVIVNQVSGATDLFTNTSISTLNNQTIINASETTNTILEIVTNQSVVNASVSIAMYTENPGTANIGLPALNKYLEIIASPEINNTLSWMIIKVYYNYSDISSIAEENALRIYYFNGTGWEPYNSPYGGVNTTGKYVWANTTHFSLYGIFVTPYCGDGKCDTDIGESCSNCEPDCGPCKTTPPSSGGGGGGFAPSVDKIVKKTSGAILKIEVYLKEKKSGLRIKISELDTIPKEKPKGIVYKYFEINKTNFNNSEIENATINFKVNLSWISENNLDKNTVSLLRFVEDKWEKLKTKLVNETGNFIEYETETPGFSYFVISGEKKKEKICEPNTKRCSDNLLQQCSLDGTAWTITETCDYGCNSTSLTCNIEPTKITENATTTPPKNTTVTPPIGFVFLTPTIISGIIAGILIVIAGLIFWQRKKEQSKEPPKNLK